MPSRTHGLCCSRHFGVDEQEWEPMDVDYGSMLFEISQVGQRDALSSGHSILT